MLRGVGLAVGGWMGGLQPASAIVCLNSDGTINVTVGSSDITGTNTAFQPIPAEVLHLPLSLVGVTASDTAPYAGMSAGSKTMYTVGRAVKLAAEDAGSRCWRSRPRGSRPRRKRWRWLTARSA